MSNEITPLESKHIEKVNKFREKTGVTLHTIGGAIRPRYTNKEHLEEFYEHKRGTLTGRVMGKIEIFIKAYKKKKL